MLAVTRIEKIVEDLQQDNLLLEEILKGLNNYLEVGYIVGLAKMAILENVMVPKFVKIWPVAEHSVRLVNPIIGEEAVLCSFLLPLK